MVANLHPQQFATQAKLKKRSILMKPVNVKPRGMNLASQSEDLLHTAVFMQPRL